MPSKWRTFRVTTARPCSIAVAAISRSAPAWPWASASRPQRRATFTIDRQDACRIVAQNAVEPLGEALREGRVPSLLLGDAFSLPRSSRRSGTDRSPGRVPASRPRLGSRRHLRSSDSTMVSSRYIRAWRRGVRPRADRMPHRPAASPGSWSTKDGALLLQRLEPRILLGGQDDHGGRAPPRYKRLTAPRGLYHGAEAILRVLQRPG